MPSGGQNKISRRELVRDLTGLARSLGKAPTQKEYTEHGRFSVGAVQTEFGTWNGAKDELGLEVHHRNDTRVTVACEVCGTEVEKRPSRIEDAEYLYCSRACQNEHKSERYTGDGNPRSTLEAVACASCGATLQRADWLRDRREKHFCDRECMGDWREDNIEGEEHPRWKDFPTNECGYCGKAFSIKPSLASEQRYCSRSCKDEDHDLSGPENPLWDGGPVTKECENCGDEYDVKQSEADESRFCSYECFHEIGHPSGPDHPQWNPDSERLYYGPNWMEQRRKALVRDQARCQNPDCRLSEPDNIALHSVGLDVHHKKSLREFKESGEDDEIDYDSANDLSNLVSLCRSCHREVESDSHSLTV